MNLEQFKNMLIKISDKIEKEKDYLSQLDRSLGDGDHGITMSIGWQAVRSKLKTSHDLNTLEEACKITAMTFLNAVGSSVGPLYASAFLRASQVVKGKEVLTDEDVIEIICNMGMAIQEKGKAEVGDKTMVDTWIPAVRALQQAWQKGLSLSETLDQALEIGKRGMESTVNMVSKKGRSSRLGERSYGHQDPGATSAFMILEVIAESVKQSRNRDE